MTPFRVWAPKAERVELVVDGEQRIAMRAADGGWHEAEADATDYAFALDGGDPRPDPRSPWQPNGVHGPSRVVDHTAFAWTDGDWRGVDLVTAVVYELHVGTFSPEGTFDGVIGKLDHLVDLGVDMVELMPVAAFPGDRGWGYDGVDLYAPHQAYGGPDGLKRLVDACHGRGLGVLLDVVYNHVGPSGNYLREFGPYFTDRYETPWGEAVNFDGPDNHEVRRFVVDNALMWLRDYHVDGLRLDAVHAIFDSSAVHILEQLAIETAELAASLGRRLVLIAESEVNDPRLFAYGLDSVWHDEFHHALHAVLTGERTGYYAPFGSVEDIETALHPSGVDAGERLVGFLQNHDQVGNRAKGERISHLTSIDRVRAGAAIVMTAPFVALLFQGEEWAASTPFQYFTDHQDPELAEAVRDGRRREFAAFGWRPEDVPDPQAVETFERSKLDWTELEQSPHAEMLEWYRRLIAVRRARPGETTVAVDFAADPATVVITPPLG